MTKSSMKNKIINLLSNSPFGLNIKNISENLNSSRTTISKYLKILENDGLILNREIGQNKIWFHKDVYYLKKDSSNPFNSLIFSIYSSLLKNLEATNQDPKYIKKLGKLIAQDLNLSDFIEKNYLVIPKEIPESDRISDLLMKIIDSVCEFYDDYSWEPPIIVKDKAIIILRMKNSNFVTNSPFHFYLISGFIENEMNKYVSAQVNVSQIHNKEKLVDFQFEIRI